MQRLGLDRNRERWSLPVRDLPTIVLRGTCAIAWELHQNVALACHGGNFPEYQGHPQAYAFLR